MKKIEVQATILVAEDDAADRLLIEKAIKQNNAQCGIVFCSNGEEVLDYLHQREGFEDVDSAPRPLLIFLDLNMPKKNGREVLSEIKTTPELKAIPTVVLTTSSAKEDVDFTYETGGNSFITKPSTYEELVHLMGNTEQYWFNTVSLPKT